jgi:hypothetical protein
LDIRPDNLFYSLQVLVQRIANFGIDTFRWALQYFLLGAIVVIPIWLIRRLLVSRRDPRP